MKVMFSHISICSGEEVSWVQCDKCEEWFHMICIGVAEDEISETEDYICFQCRNPHVSRPALPPLPDDKFFAHAKDMFSSAFGEYGGGGGGYVPQMVRSMRRSSDFSQKVDEDEQEEFEDEFDDDDDDEEGGIDEDVEEEDDEEEDDEIPPPNVQRRNGNQSTGFRAHQLYGRNPAEFMPHSLPTESDRVTAHSRNDSSNNTGNHQFSDVREDSFNMSEGRSMSSGTSTGLQQPALLNTMSSYGSHAGSFPTKVTDSLASSSAISPQQHAYSQQSKLVQLYHTAQAVDRDSGLLSHQPSVSQAVGRQVVMHAP